MCSILYFNVCFSAGFKTRLAPYSYLKSSETYLVLTHRVLNYSTRAEIRMSPTDKSRRFGNAPLWM